MFKCRGVHGDEGGREGWGRGTESLSGLVLRLMYIPVPLQSRLGGYVYACEYNDSYQRTHYYSGVT